MSIIQKRAPMNQVHAVVKAEPRGIDSNVCSYTWMYKEQAIGSMKLSVNLNDRIVFIDDYQLSSFVQPKVILATLRRYIQDLEQHYQRILGLDEIWIGLKFGYGGVKDVEFWSEIGEATPVHGDTYGDIDIYDVDKVQPIIAI